MRNLKTLTILFRTHSAFRRYIEKDLAKHDLSTAAFGTLEALYHKGELNAKQLSEKVLIRPSSMTYTLDQLVKKGLIQKRHTTHDARVITVSLTPSGKTLMDTMFLRHQEAMRSVLDVLSDKEEAQLQSLLKRIGTVAYEKSK